MVHREITLFVISFCKNEISCFKVPFLPRAYYASALCICWFYSANTQELIAWDWDWEWGFGTRDHVLVTVEFSRICL